MPRLWQAPFVGIAVANSVLFWLCVQALFDEDFVVGPGHAAIWLMVMGIGAANCATGFDLATPLGRIGVVAQRAAPLLFAALAALSAAATWRSDLVERRRLLRAFIVTAGTIYTIALVTARVAAPGGRLPGTVATFDMLALLAISGVVAFGTLGFASWDLFPIRRAGVALPEPAPPCGARPAPSSRGSGVDETSPDDARWLLSLQCLMQDEKAYRVEGLTLGGLATRLALPEYRLRRLINRRLGYRNFNEFVNAFRLDDARAALTDPMRRALPILTIALDAGFQSIGPFNRAFKAATGSTPTEFRRANIADS